MIGVEIHQSAIMRLARLNCQGEEICGPGAVQEGQGNFCRCRPANSRIHLPLGGIDYRFFLRQPIGPSCGDSPDTRSSEISAPDSLFESRREGLFKKARIAESEAMPCEIAPPEAISGNFGQFEAF